MTHTDEVKSDQSLRLCKMTKIYLTNEVLIQGSFELFWTKAETEDFIEKKEKIQLQFKDFFRKYKPHCFRSEDSSSQARGDDTRTLLRLAQQRPKTSERLTVGFVTAPQIDPVKIVLLAPVLAN